MMRLTCTRLLIWIAVALMASTSAALADDAATLDRMFPRSTLQIATPDARLHRFRIWVADDDMRRARGLMYVKALQADEGMLFIYPQPQQISMWMKNTFIPLDMVFIGKDGRVTHVVENTEPHSEKTIESNSLAKAVLELKAGTAARLKVAPGAHVIHEVFSGE